VLLKLARVNVGNRIYFALDALDAFQKAVDRVKDGEPAAPFVPPEDRGGAAAGPAGPLAGPGRP
jgi:hypothetical protein